MESPRKLGNKKKTFGKVRKSEDPKDPLQLGLLIHRSYRGTTSATVQSTWAGNKRILLRQPLEITRFTLYVRKKKWLEV